MQLIERSLGYHWCGHISMHEAPFSIWPTFFLQLTWHLCSLQCFLKSILQTWEFIICVAINLYRGQYSLKNFILFADYLRYVKGKCREVILQGAVKNPRLPRLSGGLTIESNIIIHRANKIWRSNSVTNCIKHINYNVNNKLLSTIPAHFHMSTISRVQDLMLTSPNSDSSSKPSLSSSPEELRNFLM